MSKYELLLFDLDGTLLDFDKGARIGMANTLEEFGLQSDDTVVDAYLEINEMYWQKYERGEIEKQRLMVQRHRALFERFGFTADAAAFNAAYMARIANSAFWIDGAQTVLEYLRREYRGRTAIVTNGTYDTQVKRIAKTNLCVYFNRIYISEQIGCAKPQVGIFEYIFADMGGEVDREKVLIVGDSLTSDIRGGNNAGINTCWYNPQRKVNDQRVRVDYEIGELHEIKDIVER